MSSLERLGICCCWLFYIFSLNFTVECKPQTELNDFLFSGALEFTDLSHFSENDTSCLTGIKPISISTQSGRTRIEGVWYGDDELCQQSFFGTQIDAPHYSNTSWSVGNIPFRNLITPLIVIDLNNYVAGNADFVLERQHMDYLFHGDTRRNFTVLFRFGWSRYFNNKEKYLGGSNPSQFNYPGISKDVAEWISSNKHLVGVAVDTPSIDPGSKRQSGEARKVLTKNNVFIVENIHLKQEIPRSRCTIIIMPMKFQDGTSAPCRVMSICPKILGNSLF